MAKARIFVDYWNFQLNIIKFYGNGFRIDWKKVSPWLMSQLEAMVKTDIEYEGTSIYASFDKSKYSDCNLINWIDSFLRKLPGYEVSLVERKPKNPPICPHCHTEITFCPECNKPMTATIEKGVDTAIVTDLISLAWENSWEYAILITSDKDFIPAVDMLNRKGFHVINAYFPPVGSELVKHCWANIPLNSSLTEIEYSKT